jgi:hypothetical protein
MMNSLANSRPALFPNLAEWPKCSSSLVFIWEALNIAGKAIHGDGWSGAELDVLDWPISPRDQLIAARRSEAEQRLRAPKNIYPASRPGIRRSREIEYRESYSEHMKDWWAQKLRPSWERNHSALDRLHRTAEWLHTRFREGEIGSSTRFVAGGGDPVPIPPSEWFCEGAFLKRFVPGRYDRLLPRLSRVVAVYIFVDRSDLERAIAALALPQVVMSGTSPAGLDVESLSPYLRLALFLAEKFQNYTGKKQSILDEINVCAERFGLDNATLGKEAREHLATFIRDPKYRLGRALKDGG